MMSTYNMTISNPAMAPRGGGMAGLLPLHPPLYAAACAEGVSPFVNDDKFSVIRTASTTIIQRYCY